METVCLLSLKEANWPLGQILLLTCPGITSQIVMVGYGPPYVHCFWQRPSKDPHSGNHFTDMCHVCGYIDNLGCNY